MTKHLNFKFEEKRCRDCSALLDDSNRYQSLKKTNNYICITCTRKRQKERRELIKDYIFALTDDEFLEIIVRKHYESTRTL